MGRKRGRGGGRGSKPLLPAPDGGKETPLPVKKKGKGRRKERERTPPPSCLTKGRKEGAVSEKKGEKTDRKKRRKKKKKKREGGAPLFRAP